MRLLYILSLISFFSCKAQKPVNNFEYRNDNKSLLWEISGNGLQQPSYFFGTMHIVCPGDAKLSPQLKTVIKDAGQIYFEMDLDNIGELMMGVLGMKMKTDSSLQTTLTAEEYARVQKFFNDNEMGPMMAMLQKMPPMFLTMMAQKVFMPCKEEDGMEMAIMREAQPLKKETLGLETMAFQMGLFNDMPYAQQAKDLLKTIDSADVFKKQMPEMIAEYKKQDIDELLKMSMDEDSGNSSMEDVLLTKRNANWVVQFDTIAKAKPTLFAVGAAHLGGNKGVLNLLKQKGYTVKAVKND